MDDVAAFAAGRQLNADPARLTSGMLMLICHDIIRPDLSWLVLRRSRRLREVMAEVRDPAGFADLAEAAGPDVWAAWAGQDARNQIARIIAAKGGTVRDITVGDCLEMRRTHVELRTRSSRGGALFYALLRDCGLFPDDAPVSLRHFTVRAGQYSPAELIDRYDIQDQRVRDLLVDYLTERQLALDYTSLDDLSRTIGLNFWSNLEKHHPGINSLHLAADVATAWKRRMQTKVEYRREADGTQRKIESPRMSFVPLLTSVRAFYLDLAQWAVEDPARWGPWAVPCPISAAECTHRKHERQQKARADERTRARLPVLPTLIRVAQQALKDAQARLEALRDAPAGSSFTVLGATFRKAASSRGTDPSGSGYAHDSHGRRRNLANEEHLAFWTWAAIEFLRSTGVRIEEMLETSHHSIVQFRLPATDTNKGGEVVPLLQIAPSKTDEERLLLVSPELADVLSSIVSRVREHTGAIPLVSSYDTPEKVWNPPMPLLFQRRMSGQNLALTANQVRRNLNRLLEQSGLTDAAGQPLQYQPHDFRRMFVTDAILNGLPPHIAQIICGHKQLSTTMGYKATYPTEAIEAHRAFIARRRATRPSEEYRTPTPEEWEEFLGQFERRKLSIGVCGRAYGTSCDHEHACIRCPMLRPDSAQRPRLLEIRDNLVSRIAEAQREGWLGEMEGLQVSLAGAEQKLTQLDTRLTQSRKAVELGMPSFEQITGRAK
ncbi:tyrosine-type recombinase/integrase [Streptomyces goshikiensis]|uniref:tyrosine-type recombinase/integrase n=1 Tax=Streptomyces goshikiensis TaxID=1942 RepID=UPI00365CFBE5